MNSFVESALELTEAGAADRLGPIRVQRLGPECGGVVRVAQPAGGGRRWRRPAPLLLVVGSRWLGPAIEMTRLLAGSREAWPCAVACIEPEGPLDNARIHAAIASCRQYLRIDGSQVALFADVAQAPATLAAFATGASGAKHCIVAGDASACAALSSMDAARAARVACTVQALPAGAASAVRWKAVPEATTAALALPALLHGLRQFLGRAHRYGDEVLPLARPAVARVIEVVAPLLRPLTRRPTPRPDVANSRAVRARKLDRDFEVFAALPERRPGETARRLPAVLALDANGGFATVAAIAASLREAGAIRPCIVVGIGTPRSEGELEFGYRRFEELSPPAAAGADWSDALSCVMRSLYALRGQDARLRLGRAADFHAFLVDDLLPRLCAELPVDRDDLHLLGHSAAGTFVAYAMTRPDAPFRGYACLSPGAAISQDWMLRHGRIGAGVQLYTALGSEELENPFNRISGIPATPAFVERLRKGGASAPPCEVLEGETHTTVYPRAVAQALRALLGRN